jgi:hypothetical protein
MSDSIRPTFLRALNRPITICAFCQAEVLPDRHATHWRGCEKHPAHQAMRRVNQLLRAGSIQAAIEETDL